MLAIVRSNICLNDWLKLLTLHPSRLKREAQRYNKSYPGEMVHVDTKRLPLIKGQNNTNLANICSSRWTTTHANCTPPSYLIKPNSVLRNFLTEHLLAQCPTRYDYIYSDNGKGIKCTPNQSFVQTWFAHTTSVQRFTRDCSTSDQWKGRARHSYYYANVARAHSI